MADARRVRAESRATLTACITQTAPAGDGAPRRSPSPVANTATGPTAHEQQASPLQSSVRRDGRIVTPSLTPAAASSSDACRGPVNTHAALLMAHELLRYCPTDDLYEEWLYHITELVSAAGEAPAPSCSLPTPPPLVGDVAYGAPPPPPRQDVVLKLRREVPLRDPLCRTPARDEESYQVVQRLQGEAHALPALPRQDRVPPEAMVHERQDQAPPPRRAPVSAAGCRMFTLEMCHIVWPGKFKPDLPPCYDDTPDPAEFLQLYELSIEAANDDEKVMAN